MTENRLLGTNEMWCAIIITFICVKYVQTDFCIRILINGRLQNIILFKKLPHINT